MVTQDQGSMIRFHPVTHCSGLACRTSTLQPASEQGFSSLPQSMAASVLSQPQKSEIWSSAHVLLLQKKVPKLTVSSNTPGLKLHSMLFSQPPFTTLKSYNVLHRTKLWPHRIIEYPELAGAHQDDQAQLLSLHRTPQESHHMPKSPGRLGAVTASLGSLFQGPTTTWVKTSSPNIQPKPPLTQL